MARAGGVVKIDTGKQLNKTSMVATGKYPVFNGGVKPSGYCNDYNTDENTIIISQGGASAGYVNFIRTKFWASSHCFVVTPKIKEINNKYIYYCLKNIQNLKIMNLKQGAGIPNLPKEKLLNLKIPIPTIETQNYIVEILDKFDKLTWNLQEGIPAEINYRHKQYEYYRTKLLTFKVIEL